MTATDQTKTPDIPPGWGGLSWAQPVGWLAATAGIAGAVAAWRADNLALLVGLALAGMWALAVCLWLAREVGIAVVVVAGLVLGALGWWTGYLVPAAAAVIATGVAIFFGRRALSMRNEIADSMVWVMKSIGPLTRDERPVNKVLAPTWNNEHGLPIKWRYPEVLTPDPKKIGEYGQVFSSRLGIPVSIEWGKRVATVSAKATTQVESDFTVRQLNSIVGVIPDAKVVSYEVKPDKPQANAEVDESTPDKAQENKAGDKSKPGDLVRLEFAWPPESTSSLKAARRKVVPDLRDVFEQPLTIDWSAKRASCIVTPLAPLPDFLPLTVPTDGNLSRLEFGQFRDGTPIVWDLDSTEPSLLIVGTTGAGKTNLLVVLCALLSRIPGAEVFPVDPKIASMIGIEGIPGVHKPVDEPADIVERLEWFHATMMERFQARKRGDVTREELAPMVLALDEGQTMVARLNRFWKFGEGKEHYKDLKDLEKAPATGSEHPTLSLIPETLQLVREAHAHVILAAQQPGAKWLGTDARDQFSVRVALGNLPRVTSIMTYDTPIASQGLDGLKGRAWASTKLGISPGQGQIKYVPKLDAIQRDEDYEIFEAFGIPLPTARAPRPVIELSKPVEEPAFIETGDVVEDEPVDMVTGEQISPAEAEAGMRVWVEVDGEQIAVTVDDIDEDDMDPDNLVLTYVDDDGEQGAISLSDSDTLTRAA